MAAGSRIEFDDNKIIARNRSEVIKITISEMIHCYNPAEWHDNKIHMLRTEAELIQKLINELKADFPNDEYIEEYDTKSLGLIDLVRIDASTIYHSYEVKRKKASIANVSQAIRYVEYLSAINKKCVGYIVAPSITENALEYAESKHIIVKIIDF
jgi:RecB family endonuclease NucS